MIKIGESIQELKITNEISGQWKQQLSIDCDTYSRILDNQLNKKRYRFTKHIGTNSSNLFSKKLFQYVKKYDLFEEEQIQLTRKIVQREKGWQKNSQVHLLKSGNYLVTQETKHNILYVVISFCSFVSFIEKLMQNQVKYVGFRYVLNKSMYVGQFKILNEKIVYDGRGVLFEQTKENESKIQLKWEGLWRANDFVEGQRHKQKNGLLIEDYQGQFKEMKYDGKGQVKFYDRKSNNVKIEKKTGIFLEGNFVREVMRQI